MENPGKVRPKAGMWVETCSIGKFSFDQVQKVGDPRKVSGPQKEEEVR